MSLGDEGGSMILAISLGFDGLALDDGLRIRGPLAGGDKLKLSIGERP